MLEIAPRRSKRWRPLCVRDAAVSAALSSQPLLPTRSYNATPSPTEVVLSTSEFHGADEDVIVKFRTGTREMDRKHFGCEVQEALSATRRRDSQHSVGRRRKQAWTCSGCNKAKRVPVEFSEWLKSRVTVKRCASARCNDCRARSIREEEAKRRKSVAWVVKYSESCESFVSTRVLENDKV